MTDQAGTNGQGPESVLEFQIGALTVAINGRTGLLAGVSGDFEGKRVSQAVSSQIEFVIGGAEIRSPFGGLDVRDAEVIRASSLISANHDSSEGRLVVVTASGPLVTEWDYRAGRRGDMRSLRVDMRVGRPDLAEVGVSAGIEPSELLLRDTTWNLNCASTPGAVVAAPGNRMRPGIALEEIDGVVAVNTAGGTPGSSGLVALSGEDESFVIWPFSKDAIGATRLSRVEQVLKVEVETGLASALEPGDSVNWGPVWLYLSDQPWSRLRDDIARLYDDLGLSVPADSPEWTHAPSIFEVQIGKSRFGGPADYSPYPDVADLRADLPRIASLGFDTVQIMPRQPYPSYNVADWFDIETSYGSEEELRKLVTDAHARGIRVILDVLMHGVLDQEFMSQATAAVRSGPHGPFLEENPWYSFADTVDLEHPEQVPWSQHLLDFERDWLGGSPVVHPLFKEHPEWFFQDSTGGTSGIYTRAFELGNPGWQQYLLSALRNLIERLGIDGFRFDAPTYNGFPNWSPQTRKHASASELACLQLFARLRDELKPTYPDLMFYTEPSGVLLRESMDLVYNYDEHAQLEDAMQYEGVALGGVGRSRTGVRNAAELMQWFSERNACLPPGAVTAHHIDSHDTFWWPRPGQKWRREQFGLDAARALASVFALSGGPYMTFVGGEQGMERHLANVHALRKTPPFYWGDVVYEGFSIDQRHVYAVERVSGGDRALVLVNLSDRPTPALVGGRSAVSETDLLDGMELEIEQYKQGFSLALPAWGTAVVAVTDMAAAARNERTSSGA